MAYKVILQLKKPKMADLIFPIDFDEKCTMAQGDYILFSDSEDGDKIKKAQYRNLKGETGNAATIEVGCVSTGCPGTSVCICNSGDCNNAIFDFTIPQGDKGDTGDDGASICCADFDGNNIVFGKDNGCCVVLADAKTCLQGPQGCKGDTGATGNGICCATLNPDYTLTLQYTNGCSDTTGSIRGPQGEQGCEGPQGCQGPIGCTGPAGNGICCTTLNPDYTLTFQYTNGCCDTTASVQGPQGCTGATGNGICCTTCNKVGKTTTVELQYTDGTCFDFSVQDGQDGLGNGDMLACVYDPNGCAKNVFDYDNLDNKPDLSCYQEKLTAGNNITINANTISGDFNYATSSTAADCTTKCVCIPEITQLCVGQQITVKPSVTATNCATSLKLNDFTAYPVRYMNAALTSSTDGYVRGANCLTTFLFDGSYWQVASKSYDTNTTYALNILYDAGKYTAGTGTYALSRYSLVMEKDDGTWEKITNTSAAYSTATTKTVNTNGFRLNHIRYYNTTTNVATGALIATNTLQNQAASVDLRYSTNCGGTTTWAEGDYIYLVGTIKTDGLFYLDTTQWWTNQLPGSNDGKLYIRIGLCLAANGYTASFLVDRPIYYYDNGIKVYQQVDNKQDTLVSGTNIKTVNGCSLLGSGDICICGGGGTGDMEVCVYDPCGCNGDAFDYCNFHNTPTAGNGIDITSNTISTASVFGQSSTAATCTEKSVCIAGVGSLTTGQMIIVKPTITSTTTTTMKLKVNNFTSYNILYNGSSVTDATTAGLVWKAYVPSIFVLDDTSGTTYWRFAGHGYDENTTYSSMGTSEIDGGTCTCCRVITAANLKYAVQHYSPTDNCELGNGCGYTTCTGTLSSCSDIVTALGYTPYSSANPNGYTTCTGTLQSCDIATVNGCCLTNGGSITIDGGNIKTFYLTGTTGATNIATAQEALDWYNSGKNPIISYSDKIFVVNSYSSTGLEFIRTKMTQSNSASTSYGTQTTLTIKHSSGTVSEITDVGTVSVGNYLATNINYLTPYTPQYDGSPATKKYVDDTVACCSGGIQNDTTCTSYTLGGEWVGTTDEFSCLTSFGCTIYNIIE